MHWRSLNKHLNGVLIFRMKSGSRNKTIKQRLWKDLAFSLLFTLKSKGECQSQESWQSTAGESQSQCRWHKSPITEWNLGFDPCTVFSCLCGHHKRFEAEAKKEFKSYGMEPLLWKNNSPHLPFCSQSSPCCKCHCTWECCAGTSGCPRGYICFYLYLSAYKESISSLQDWFHGGVPGWSCLKEQSMTMQWSHDLPALLFFFSSQGWQSCVYQGANVKL